MSALPKLSSIYSIYGLYFSISLAFIPKSIQYMLSSVVLYHNGDWMSKGGGNPVYAIWVASRHGDPPLQVGYVDFRKLQQTS